MMYIIFIIDHIHHLINEYKILIFAYNSDRRVYSLNALSLVNTKYMHINVHLFCIFFIKNIYFVIFKCLFKILKKNHFINKCIFDSNEKLLAL